jgi:hypothetical protein
MYPIIMNATSNKYCNMPVSEDQTILQDLFETEQVEKRRVGI